LIPLGMDITRAVKDEASRLGFDLVGVTTPDPPAHFDVFERWLRRGSHGEMAYLATERSLERRKDPRAILDGCESVIVLGMRYAAPAALYLPLPSGEGRGWVGVVASYAWGDDYHTVMPERMRALVAFIEERVGRSIDHRLYTDTGPLLERELAQRAGLGWIGKNTCLINPQQGSYFLLGEILLDVALQPDAPFDFDRCGSCTRCLDACPTGCILPDRTIDARRCISYLTIELKDAIPPDLRAQVGSWVFGCDVCQQVCPWNRRHTGDRDWEEDVVPAFQPREGVPYPSLDEELGMDDEEFRRKFKGSPLKRAKRWGYLRNVATALGNAGAGMQNGQREKVLSALERCLFEEPEELVRSHAAWALGQVGGGSAVQALGAALQSEQEEHVLAEIRAALGSNEG